MYFDFYLQYWNILTQEIDQYMNDTLVTPIVFNLTASDADLPTVGHKPYVIYKFWKRNIKIFVEDRLSCLRFLPCSFSLFSKFDIYFCKISIIICLGIILAWYMCWMILILCLFYVLLVSTTTFGGSELIRRFRVTIGLPPFVSALP